MTELHRRDLATIAAQLAAMLMLLLIAIQVQPAPPGTPPERIDLTAFAATPQGCGSGNDADIVVCARRKDTDRLQRIPERYVDQRLRPEIGVAGGKAGVRAEQRSLPGATAPALMLDFKLPF